MFRPPYGAIDSELVETVKAKGYYIILWDVDSLDWRSLYKDQVIENILPNIHPEAIIHQKAQIKSK
ncbi:MAG: polysaccharide deacetylase family protein [Halanaerobiales bacterium]|nr:polysaccharide deacetylase family protein [Halanaerobiales bacterium]